MKILWISEYNMPSGFARVSKSLIKHLQKKSEITVLDWYADTDSFSHGVKVLGKKSKTDELAIKRLLEIYNDYDAIFILNDVWNIARILRALKNDTKISRKLPKIIPYFPVDAKLHSETWYRDFDIVSAPVTYTEFAKSVISQCAPQVAEKIQVIPHGIDSDTFFKSMTDKKVIRQYLYGTTQLNDAFIFMNANRNQMRKRLDITIRAFAKFLAATNAQNAFLHLHCGLTDYGYNIADLVKRLGIDEYILITGKTEGMQNISSELLNLYYNAADVGINSSMGEGWGLTNCEHAITGAPQIVPNHSAPRELFHNKAWLINSVQEMVFQETNTIGKVPDYIHMAAGMEQYWKDAELRQKHSALLADYFLQPQFNWTNISEKFYSLFIS